MSSLPSRLLPHNRKAGVCCSSPRVHERVDCSRKSCNLAPLQFGYVRVAIAAECFLPQRNGVTNSVLRILEFLQDRGHETLVIAPGPGASSEGGTPVERTQSLPLPIYRDLPVAIPTGRIEQVLHQFSPDILHLAAPAVLGPAAARVARDGHAGRRYLPDRFRRIRSALRLAGPRRRSCGKCCAERTVTSTSHCWRRQRRLPGSFPVTGSVAAIWARGVDAALFHPGRRSELLRRRLAPHGEVVVGYVGRLASEKRVHLLEHLRQLAVDQAGCDRGRPGSPAPGAPPG